VNGDGLALLLVGREFTDVLFRHAPDGTFVLLLEFGDKGIVFQAGEEPMAFLLRWPGEAVAGNVRSGPPVPRVVSERLGRKLSTIAGTVTGRKLEAVEVHEEAPAVVLVLESAELIVVGFSAFALSAAEV